MTSSIVLVCEDQDAAAAIASHLQSAGHEVETFHAATDAVRRFGASKAKPVCLVTGTSSAGISGWDLVRIARQHNRHIAVVYLVDGDPGDWLVQGVPNSEMLEAGWKPGQLPTAVSLAIARIAGASPAP